MPTLDGHIVAALIILFVAAFYVLVFSLCRMAAQADDRIRLRAYRNAARGTEDEE